MSCFRNGEIGQCLRTLAAVIEDAGSNPSTHMLTAVPRYPMPFLASKSSSYEACGVYTYTCKYAYMYMYSKCTYTVSECVCLCSNSPISWVGVGLSLQCFPCYGENLKKSRTWWVRLIPVLGRQEQADLWGSGLKASKCQWNTSSWNKVETCWASGLSTCTCAYREAVPWSMGPYGCNCKHLSASAHCYLFSGKVLNLILDFAKSR